MSELADAKIADSYAYWGDVNETGNDQVRQEVLDFVCPTHQPEQLRDSLTKTVPKARIIPNKVVTQTKGDQYERLRLKHDTLRRSRRLLCNCLSSP